MNFLQFTFTLKYIVKFQFQENEKSQTSEVEKLKKEKKRSSQEKLYVWTCAKIIKPVTVSCRVQNIINFSIVHSFISMDQFNFLLSLAHLSSLRHP